MYSMGKCIYYKDRQDLTFTKREHIFPRCIGGVNRLNLGIVSDQANEFFANNLEVKTMRESVIAISKILLGPKKKPSKEKHRHKTLPEFIANKEIDSRTMGKIALNVLASIKGQDFVLLPELDEFREWIMNGGNDWYHCEMGAKRLSSNAIMPEHAHYCIFAITEDYIIADVCLYNYWQKMFAICKRFDDSFVNPDGLICDWKNKKELRLIDIILSSFSETF